MMNRLSYILCQQNVHVWCARVISQMVHYELFG